MKSKCPICKRAVTPDVTSYPFCSERCRDEDLGNWASEKYVIPAPLDEDGIERLIEETGGQEFG